MSTGEVATAIMKTAAQLDLEQELRAGRDVTVQVNREASMRSRSSVSALSEGQSNDNNGEDGAAMDLLEETERLLAKMNNLSKLNASAVAGMSSDAGSASASNGVAMNVTAEAEDDSDLNEMLEKAGQLSTMMQSISENISLNGGSYVNNSHTSSRDPDGNNLKVDTKMNTSAAPVELTPTTTDEASSYAGKRSIRQDPPGSVATKDENHKTPVERNNHSPASSIQRPTSAVHLPLAMMDDDVSSVGSASFRPYHRSESKGSRHFSPTFTHMEHPEMVDTPEKHDALLGVLPPKLDLTTNTDSPDDEDMPAEPVCSKIPPTDLRADFDVMETSTRTEATEGTVQWEKVTTATPGEDDYVPMADYTHMRPSQGRTSGNVESRLERHRRRSQARNKRQMRFMTTMLPIVVLAIIYYYVRQPVKEEPVVVEEVVVVEEPLFQSYDTTLLQDPAADGFSFEGEDSSLLVTLPKLIPPPKEPEVVVEKPKRRGLFGRRKKD